MRAAFLYAACAVALAVIGGSCSSSTQPLDGFQITLIVQPAQMSLHPGDSASFHATVVGGPVGLDRAVTWNLTDTTVAFLHDPTSGAVTVVARRPGTSMAIASLNVRPSTKAAGAVVVE